jgi:AP2 domain.
MRVPVGRDGLYALVDDQDYELVSSFAWFVMRRPRGVIYARRQFISTDGRKREQRMHSLITGWPEVDHANLDGLDNRRSNLRRATHGQNVANRRKLTTRTCASKYKGVTWDRKHNKWAVQLWVGGARIWGGRFTEELDAAIAYDNLAIECFGEYARLNLVQEGDFA